MRGLPVAASVAIGLGLLHCGTNSSGSGSVVPAADSGTNSDGGTAADGGGSTDAGSGSDGGVASDGGMSTDGGTSDGGTATDGGTASSDCDGLAPGAPGMATEFRWMNRDLNNNSGGSCFPAETDGTGHIAVSWQNPFQPHDSRFAFVDPASASEAGSYRAVGMLLIGQASGFMGGQCGGTICAENYVVLDPVGKELFQSPFGHGNNVQANDPTGGMIHVRFSESGEGTTMLLDAIDPSGAIRWTRPLPDVFGPQDSKAMRLGVDRQGNVLALWSSAPRYGAGTWAGQWFDHAGTPGSVFQALSAGVLPDKLYERVGDGLFLSGSSGWLGQFDAQATSMSPPPPWLAARPRKNLHMVHGGKGYAVLPMPESSAPCDQQVEVISPSGQVCGSSTFSMGGAACTTSSIIVGYDGTVVQQGPRERESCTANDHICTCTYRYWPGFFR